jgi:hypothetical protein
MGGPSVYWRPGRSDVVEEKAAAFVPPNGLLPDATKGSDHLRTVFGRQVFLSIFFSYSESLVLLGHRA